jgi:hypothetical protein
MAVLTSLVTFASVIAAKLLGDEIKAWLPWMTQRTVDLSVRFLPEDQRERFREEWLGHVSEIPGDVGKFVVALGFIHAGLGIRLEHCEQDEVVLSEYSPWVHGLETMGLLPEPEGRSGAFITSVVVNCLAIVLVLGTGVMGNHILPLFPANLLVH